MDKIHKFLSKLSKKDLRHALLILDKLEQGDFSNLDIKKLSGHIAFFRIRSGKIRVILLKEENLFRVVSIERRGDNTYRFLA